MARKKYKKLNEGDKFALHTIAFSEKLGGIRLKGQLKYVRVSPFVNQEDILDQYIREAMQLRFSNVKIKSRLYTIQTHDRHQFVRYLEFYKRYKVDLSIYGENTLEIGDEVENGEIKTFNIGIDIFYKDKNVLPLLNKGLSKKIFVSDNKWIEIKSLINDTFTTYSSFFETI